MSTDYAAAPPIPLPPLAITAVHWELEALSPGCLPPFKGSALRGTLGWAIERVARAAPAPPWPGLSPAADFLAALFSPQLAWRASASSAVHLWHLQCADPRTHWQRGERLAGRFLLFGPWPEWAIALWRDIFDAVCEQGFAGAQAPRFAVAAWNERRQSWLPAPAAPQQVCLQLLTPARLQDRGQDLTVLAAPAVARSLLRRLRQLALQTGTRWDIDYPALSHRCDALLGDELSAGIGLQRWSNRQRQRIAMPGVVGQLLISGPALPELAPLIAQAPLLHIGRQPNFGYGQCAITWNPIEAL
ncbi:MAG: CRISPR system precrRNA processing endoribonuclease RAMP protein Cas6 [Burkholderiaceae bacterium]|nr:CRISPR system precrRNA processing endoribonuclease RAMP protein Cas6 [Burkholderiaceae bacterium]